MEGVDGGIERSNLSVSALWAASCLIQHCCSDPGSSQAVGALFGTWHCSQCFADREAETVLDKNYVSYSQRAQRQVNLIVTQRVTDYLEVILELCEDAE